MRRAMLLIVGFGTGGLLLFALCTVVAAQYAQLHIPLQEQVFPGEVEGTFLRAVQLASYEGPYWEDGTGEEIVDIAALVVENIGCCYVYQGAVVLDWGEDRMVFELSWLPPGEKVLVLEKERKPYREMSAGICYGWTSEIYPENAGFVTVEQTKNAGLTFINRTDRTVDSNAVYKHYDEVSGMYIGGIAYTVSVLDLQPRESRTIIPWLYAPGYSRVVCVMPA